MTAQAEDIDLASPSTAAIIDRIAREKPWRWWPDYWFAYVIRRWPLFIYTTCFALAHHQDFMLLLSIVAFYADWRYLPCYAQDFRLSARDLAAHIIKNEPIPSLVPNNWWGAIKRFYIFGGIVVLATIVLLTSFSGTIIEAGLERPAFMLLAFEWYVVGVASLVLIGYFTVLAPSTFLDRVEGDPNPTRARLRIASRYGPSSYKFGAKAMRVLCPIFAVLIGVAYLGHFDTYSRDYSGFPGQLETESVFEPAFVTFVVAMNVVVPAIITYQLVARRFLSLYARNPSPQTGV